MSEPAAMSVIVVSDRHCARAPRLPEPVRRLSPAQPAQRPSATSAPPVRTHAASEANEASRPPSGIGHPIRAESRGQRRMPSTANESKCADAGDRCRLVRSRSATQGTGKGIGQADRDRRIRHRARGRRVLPPPCVIRSRTDPAMGRSRSVSISPPVSSAKTCPAMRSSTRSGSIPRGARSSNRASSSDTSASRASGSSDSTQGPSRMWSAMRPRFRAATRSLHSRSRSRKS